MINDTSKINTFPKLNEDILFNDIYDTIMQRTLVEFVANTDDIGLNGIENEVKNVTVPFQLPELQKLTHAIDLLIMDAMGKIIIEPYIKIRLLMKAFNGEIYYRKINNREEWKVCLIFKTTESIGYY